MSKYGVISGPYFRNLRIQSEYKKIRARNSSVFGHFSRSDTLLLLSFAYSLAFTEHLRMNIPPSRHLHV